MNIKYGDGITEDGPGIDIELDGEEIATAIMTYLVTNGVYVRGQRTITVNGELCQAGRVYVDPSGSVIHRLAKLSGRGPNIPATPPPPA